ncbi:MAG: sulfatase [Myxococcota bacterium]|nr:sulfatase [Myxococcota bacterium]
MKNPILLRTVLVFFFAALIMAASSCGRGRPGPSTIVLISLDTLRADHLGVYGHHRFTSPIIDAFAAQGVVFEDASATTAWTLPSHASMLTGLFPLRHGVITAKNALSEEVGTLAEWFDQAGWETAAIVNAIWLKRERYGLTRDFEKYLFVEEADYRRRSPSSWATDQAIEWLDAQRGRPLFLFLHYYDIHADYASLPEYERLFVSPYQGQADGSAWQIERANFADAHIARCLAEPDSAHCLFGSKEKPRRIDAEMERVEFNAEDVQHLEELYDAGVRQLDTELGRLLAFLDSSGRAGDTLVVITSDHGEEFLEHGRVGHSLTTYQQSLRVPLIMRGPGLPVGVRVEAPVSLVDLAPTLLALTGLPARDELDGLDLSGLWRDLDPRPFAERYLFGEASQGVQQQARLPGVYPIFRSIRRGDFKLVARSLGPETEYSLYDLAEDPEELRDISSQERSRVAEMAAALEQRHAGAQAAKPTGEAVELAPDEIEKLRALGYAP